jgi:hypothetical protein
MNAAEIHHELCPAVYSQNVTSDTTVRQWCRMFMMRSEVVGRQNVAELTGIQKLIPRYDKCLGSGSDYVEKQFICGCFV